MKRYRHVYLPLVMWLLPVTFFGYQFVLRLWPGLMMPQLMQQFGINASDFGVLASLYYYGYALMQLPMAVLLDRWGVRPVVALCSVLCALAMWAFSFTHNWWLACAARLLIGGASAAGFLSVSKVITQWFPENQYGRMVGVSFTLGLLGAVYGGKPVSAWIDRSGWAAVAWALGFVALGIGLLVLLVVKDPKVSGAQTPPAPSWKDLRYLLTQPSVVLLALVNLLLVGPLEGFADVWGVQYLGVVYALDQGDAAWLTSLIFVGMLVGGPLLATMARLLGNLRLISFCGFGMAALFTLLLSRWLSSPESLAGILLIIGILCCYQVLVFAAGAHLVRPRLLGVTVALLNCINMLGGSFFHTAIGLAMDRAWTGQFSSGGLRHYDAAVFQKALQVIPVCAVLGAGLAAWLAFRHARCRQAEDSSGPV